MNKGIYILAIKAFKPFGVSIKRFRERKFNKGYYYYVGSAQKNLKQRLIRHCKKEKTIHWHIDHITSISTNKVEYIYLFREAEKDLECTLANFIENELQLDASIRSFGNSDSNCSSSHLFYSKTKINYNHLFSLYQSIVRLIPSEIETI
jgi:Uri superfamily endonuclease